MPVTQITMGPQLRQDFAALEKAAESIARSLSEALSDGVDAGADLEKKLAQVAKAAKKLTQDTRDDVKESFEQIGSKQLKLKDNDLAAYMKAQTDAFKNTSTQSFFTDARALQKQLGVNAEAMRPYFDSIGVPEDIKEQFTKKSELQWLLEDRQASFSASADKYLQTFLDDTLPKRLGEASDAFAGLFSGIAFGTKNSSDLFADLGKSVLQTAQGIATDLMQVGMRFALFGSKENGWNGLFGGLVSGIGSWLGGLGGGTTTPSIGGAAAPSSTASSMGLDLFSADKLGWAHGGAFAAGTGLAAWRNSIVSQPTYFPFAHGIGLMGEAGAEAIMPLERNSRGDLAVNVTGISGGGGQVVNNVTVNAPPGAQVETRENRNATGGFDTEILITMVENGIAQRIAGGTSRLAAAYDRTRGINRAGSLYRN